MPLRPIGAEASRVAGVPASSGHVERDLSQNEASPFIEPEDRAAMTRRAFLLILTLAVFALPGRAMAQPSPAQRAAQDTLATVIATDPQVREGRLPNGLQYFIRQNSTPPGRAELRLVVNAGSVLEEDDQRGLAHF